MSKVWTWFRGSPPPFEYCCEEHDLAYDQVDSPADKLWADVHLGRCLSKNGYTALGIVFTSAVTVFGWFAILKGKLSAKVS